MKLGDFLHEAVGICSMNLGDLLHEAEAIVVPVLV